MRRSMMAALLLLTATPAVARGHDAPATLPSERELAELGDALANPVAQSAVAAVVDHFAAVLLDTRIGPLARYADPADRVRPDDTLADLAARRDPAYADKLHEGARQAARRIGEAASDAAALSAELRRTSERLRGLLDQTGTSGGR